MRTPGGWLRERAGQTSDHVAAALLRSLAEAADREFPPGRAGLDAGHVRLYVVRPALEWIELWSVEAEELVLATLAQESHLSWLDQLDAAGNPGPGYGLGQMEKLTHDDVWRTFLATRHDLRARVLDLVTRWGIRNQLTSSDPPDVEELHWNMMYAAAMTRVRYRRAPGALPAVSAPGAATADEVGGMARYWKAHYNTSAGRGTTDQFVASYERLVRER